MAAAPAVAVEAEEPLQIGARVDGNFEVIRRLGAGGMGVVYLARDLRLDREVALKVVRMERFHADAGEEVTRAFEREARATAALSHENVVTVHQFGSWNGLLYLVLERLRGETLGRRLARATPPLDETLRIVDEVLAGLAHAHAAGLAHRDLKPQNVFLLESGRAKVLDFGLSGLPAAGTPAYMAPEQWRGEAADARSDVWAAGIMLYEMVVGERPFAPEHARDLRPLTDEEAARLPASIRAPVARALALDPAARFADAGELRAALAGARPRPRRWRWAALAAAALVALAPIALLHRPARAPAPSSIDLTGRWRYVPDGKADLRLDRLGADTYRIRSTDGPDWRASPDYFLYEGTLTVAREGGKLVLRGDTADVPGSRFHNVGRMEFDVLDGEHLWMTRSRWGPRDGPVRTAYEPWRLVRIGR